MVTALQKLRDLRNDPEYLNFITVGEGLRILSDALRRYTEQEAKELQKQLLKKLGGFCNCHCTPGVKPCRHTCKWGNELEKLHKNKKKSRVPFHQSDNTLWHDPNGFWEVAKVFMHELGVKWRDVKNPATTDLTGLLNFLIFCKHINVDQNLLMSVRDLRNDWAHTKNYKFSASKKQAAFIAINDLMNDTELLSCKEVQDCHEAIDEVKNASVSVVHERDLEVLTELTRHQQFKRETELVNMIELILSNNTDNHQQSHTSERKFTKSLIYLGIIWFILLPVKIIKECRCWKLFSLFILVMSLVSCVSDNSVFLSDNGCPRPFKISEVNSFGFKEFDFATQLSYKRENFYGRRWFFGELNDVIIGSDEKGVLITGDPGSGKSALLSQLICTPFSNFAIHSNIIGYHICDFTEVVTRDGSSFVRNLVDQIASNIPEYASKIRDSKQLRIYLDKRCERDPTACFSMTVIGPLRELKVKPDNFKYIVIDALDECVEKDRKTSAILDILRNRLSYFPQWLKVIMSSRNWTTVTSKVPRTVHRIALNPHDERNIADIRSYISQYLRKKSSLVSMLWNTISETTEELTKHSDGNFLFVKTVLRNNLRSDGKINLHSLPKSLHDNYDQIFQRYFVKEDSVRFETLFEILFAAGSLHETEISDILQHQNLGKGVQVLLAHVSSLLHFGSDGFVSIYHQSFAEWLVHKDNRVNGFSFQKRRGHVYIANFLIERTKGLNTTMTFKQLSRLCVHVLHSGGPSDEHKKQLARINVTAIRNQQNGKSILHELAQMQNSSQLLKIFLPSFSLIAFPDFNGKTPAYYAATNGFAENLKLLINHGTCATCILNKVSSFHEIKAAMKMKRFAETSIMHAATYNGYTEVVGTLLDYNASFIEFNEYVPTLLQVASERGHLDLVKLLHSNYGAKADKIALHHAAARNHFEVVKYLLEYAGVEDECLKCKPITFPHLQRNKSLHEIHDMFCETALHAAVYTNMTKLLLQFGNSAIECKHHSGKTPLMDAVERNDTEMAELLLQNGANVEGKCGKELSLNIGETSGVRSFYGKRSLYTVYREKTSCSCGNNALHLCAKYGLWRMAKYLIKNWNARVLDKNCNEESVWNLASSSHNQDFIHHMTRILLNLDDHSGTNKKVRKMDFKQLSTFEKLLKKFSMEKTPLQSSFQCDSKFDGMSPLHIAALMGKNMLHHVYRKTQEIAPSLPLSCTNKHWITPRYLAHFYDSIPALTDESPSRLKQTYRNSYPKTMLQYPDREAEFHMIYNYFYDSLDEWKYFLLYEIFKPFEDYGIANCPGYYDMPTKKALEPSCDRYTAESEKDTDDLDEPPAQSMMHEVQTNCEVICFSVVKECEVSTTLHHEYEGEVSTELEEVTFHKPKFKSWIKEMQELMELEEYMLDCGCPKIMGSLHDMFTKMPKQNRHVNQFISERMGWKETSSGGEILKRWPIYFFHKKLKNAYQSYKYLDILNEGFKIKMSY